MPQSNFTIVRITDRMEYLGEEVLNVYHFREPGASATPNVAALASSFDSIYVSGVAAVQSTAVLHTTITVEQVNNGVEFTELAISQNGLIVDPDIGPSFVSASYKLNRSSRDIRNGRKSICGVTEDDMNGNVWSANGIAKLSNLNAVFVAPISDGTNSWQPIIKSDIDTGIPNVITYSFIASSELRGTIRHQVSRTSEI